MLTSVTAAYLPRNLRPEVASITVHPPGTVFQRPFSTGETRDCRLRGEHLRRPPAQRSRRRRGGRRSTPAPPALGRRIYQKGLQTFVWKAEDEQRRPAAVRRALSPRGRDGAGRPLKRGLWDPIVVWDTTSVPDGTYVVKVAASDAPSNSPGTALVGEIESVTFDIDNTPPHDRDAAARPSPARGRSVTFVVRDEQSAVQRVEYSLDASRWRVVYPKDGIPDSRREEFEVVLDEAEAGPQRDHPRDRRDEQRRDGRSTSRSGDRGVATLAAQAAGFVACFRLQATRQASASGWRCGELPLKRKATSYVQAATPEPTKPRPKRASASDRA